MCVTAQFGSLTRLGDEIANNEFALHSELMTLFSSDPWVQIQRISGLSIHLQTRISRF